jgi:hypothetical protein
MADWSLAGGALVLFGASAAWAAIPDSDDGEFHDCVKNTTGQGDRGQLHGELTGRPDRLSSVLRHPGALVLPTVTADAAVDVRGVRGVLEVVAAGCHQGSVERSRPFLVGLGEPHT